jgi:hypothetical protein
MKKIIFLMALVIASSSSFAQKAEKVKYEKAKIKEMEQYLFEEVFVSVSPKKISTVILKDQSVHKGYCKGVGRKKGQISSIEIKDSLTGKKEEFEATAIAEMYLFPSGFEKFGKMNKYFSNSRNWGTKDLKKTTNKEDVYFKNQLVSLKNKKEQTEYLMQLVNPSFSSSIEVYGDPNAKETASFSVGGSPSFGGGVIKSYYVKKGDKIFWLHKDDFKDSYTELFGDNPEFIKQYPFNSIEWDYFSFLVLEYTKAAEKA